VIHSLAELDRVRAECKALVTKRSLMSAGVAIVPIPGADIVADVGLLTSLLPQISARFQLDHDQVQKLEPRLAQQVLVVASGLGNNVIGRLVTRKLVLRLLQRVGIRVATASVAKYVPILGSAVAATIGFGAMKLVGNAHTDDCYATAKALIDNQDTPTADINPG
jgi:uncharacterized protein (DUF697 family)